MSLEEDSKQCARDFFAALNRGDVKAIVDAYAEDGYCHTMGRTLISGRFSKAQIAASAGLIFQAFPDGIRFTIKGTTAEGERVPLKPNPKAATPQAKLTATNTTS